jgi:hypothetical protein
MINSSPPVQEHTTPITVEAQAFQGPLYQAKAIYRALKAPLFHGSSYQLKIKMISNLRNLHITCLALCSSPSRKNHGLSHLSSLNKTFQV